MRKYIVAGVVFAVLAVVIGVFIQAIAATRRAAERTSCLNNFKQIVLCLDTIQDVRGQYPSDLSLDFHYSATVLPKDFPWEKRHSWLFVLYPLIEHRPLVGWKEAAKWPWDAPNAMIIGAELQGVCLCPAQRNMIDERGYALTHYVGLTGLGQDAHHLSADDPKAGFFGLHRKLTKDSFPDGRQNTLVFTETGTKNGPWIANGFPTARGLDPDGVSYLGENGQFNSRHDYNGKNVLLGGFADGSARLIRADLSPHIFEALVTIGGKEELPSDWQW